MRRFHGLVDEALSGNLPQPVDESRTGVADQVTDQVRALLDVLGDGDYPAIHNRYSAILE
jgi:hypothetical protein